MSSKIICAGNWKMNHGPEATSVFLKDFASAVSASERGDFALFLPALTLHQVPENGSLEGLNWGAQNIYWQTSGAFTGENSAEVVKAMGATHVLIGHSERRALFHETNADTQKKMQTAAVVGLVPVLCVGETLEERNAGKTLDIICEQLKIALKDWDSSNAFWVAYEPVWAIGTGEVATPTQAEEAHMALKVQLEQSFPGKGGSVPVLYGGSVKPENARELGAQPSVNGFLVGGASLKVDSFVNIWKEGLKGKG